MNDACGAAVHLLEESGRPWLARGLAQQVEQRGSQIVRCQFHRPDGREGGELAAEPLTSPAGPPSLFQERDVPPPLLDDHPGRKKIRRVLH